MNEKEQLNDRHVQSLIKKAKAGDQKAFTDIVRLYQKPLYYAIARIVLIHDDTDDVLQDTFLKMYQNLALFDIKRPLYPWLLTIAINLAINKKKWRLRKSEDSIENFNYSLSDNTISSAQQGEVEENELHDALCQALANLSMELRSVFVLRIHEELSYEEISKMLGISKGTVMSRLARARQKLRVLLAPYLETQQYKVKT